ncbi:hypothetical protein CRG98_032172 [Punica granatum]|uniref:Uncharacterized protein n=1 Tax=Punica granatum TaxID=22663 RepID=A0A2I0ITW6_PUNGR|nr:hypothetical protein CRG98_032172 [Punica granatum]
MAQWKAFFDRALGSCGRGLLDDPRVPVVRTRISSSRGLHARAHVHGLGASTFLWGRVTDTCEKESPLLGYDPKVEGRFAHLTRFNTANSKKTIDSDEEPEKGVGSYIEESVRYPRETIHRTVMVDVPCEPKPRSIRFTHP